MNKLAMALLPIIAFTALAACSKQQPSQATQTTPPPATAAEAAPAAATESAQTAPEAAAEATPAPPTETISETEDGQEAPAEQQATVQPALRLGAAAAAPATSSQFKEGTNYQKVVPAQPTSVGPGKVEVVEVFWYGCGHCFALDPAIEGWRAKGKAPYVEFVRVPAMWNDVTRMHARVFYTAELLGKLDTLHSLIFREINVNRDPLNTVDKIAAFFQKHGGVNKEDFTKAFSSFAVESKLQRADFLNRRYRVQSVPMVAINGKYTTDVSGAGGEQQLFTLINELAAHEHGG